ncbi:hypothetical protein SNR37_002478 [Agarivorans aestuarii]|uniref:Porin n=1 Tax=Agarivorans aestuarii TaxID=1563703 RepID=A0ABU7G164_9ALTE|nr:hypothetical protein [Agarivorans aestuarii]MEE1673065.1 hypothetical protein [Agarivorans aestuarii]
MLNYSIAALVALTIFFSPILHAKTLLKPEADSYFSITGGSGITHLDDGASDEQKKQQFRSFDIRFAQHFHKNWRVDLIHANEGHPYNHHRDGFSAHATYVYVPADWFRLEIGAGPYMSFDTTIDETGLELNEKRVGGMSTLAFIYPLKRFSESAHLRLQLNSYLMAARPNGNSLLIGVGWDIDNTEYQRKQTKYEWFDDAWVSIINTKINHGGPETKVGYSFDLAKRFHNNLALSLGYIDEGGYNGATDRSGFTTQLWKVIPLGKRFEGRMGGGGYFVVDKVEHTSAYDLKGIISFGANYYPSWSFFEDGYLGVSISRVIDRKGHQDDADLFRFSVGKRF